MAQMLARILCHQKLKHNGMPAGDGQYRPDSEGLGMLQQCRIWASSLCELESHWRFLSIVETGFDLHLQRITLTQC